MVDDHVRNPRLPVTLVMRMQCPALGFLMTSASLTAGIAKSLAYFAMSLEIATQFLETLDDKDHTKLMLQ